MADRRMRVADRTFGWLPALSAPVHAMGSLAAYRTMPELLLWALSASMCELLLAAVNLLRVDRTGDRGIAAVAAAGCIARFAIVFAFGRLLGTFADVRVLVQGTIAFALLAFSIRSLRATAAAAPQR